MNSKELADVVVDALHEMKGQSVVCIDVAKLTEITDYMVIVTGTSSTHVKALADEVVKQVKEAGGQVNGIEGRMQAEWVLVDIGGVVVHIMLPPVRALYNLEDLWNFGSEPENKGVGTGAVAGERNRKSAAGKSSSDRER